LFLDIFRVAFQLFRVGSHAGRVHYLHTVLAVSEERGHDADKSDLQGTTAV